MKKLILFVMIAAGMMARWHRIQSHGGFSFGQRWSVSDFCGTYTDNKHGIIKICFYGDGRVQVYGNNQPMGPMQEYEIDRKTMKIKNECMIWKLQVRDQGELYDPREKLVYYSYR